MAINTQIDLSLSLPDNDVAEACIYRTEEPTSLIHSVDLQVSMTIEFIICWDK